MSPLELERQGFSLKEVGGETDFPERDPQTMEPTGRVYQYYVRGDEAHALLVQEPAA